MTGAPPAGRERRWANRLRWRTDPHTLAGAYALDALAESDRARFERHLGRCEACRQEAHSLREAAARLAVAAAAPPPPRLRAAVLADAARTRQAAPAQALPRATFRPVAPRFAVAAAGLAILLALGFGALTMNARHRLGMEQARGSAIAAVLTAPDATMMSAPARGGGTATVVMSHRRRALVLTTAHLPALPSGKSYEVWLMGPAGDRAAGMLPAPRGGMTAPVIVRGLAAGDSIGLSAEPAAGARQPSAAPVLMVYLFP